MDIEINKYIKYKNIINVRGNKRPLNQASVSFGFVC